MDTYTHNLLTGIATAQECTTSKIQVKSGPRRKRINNEINVEDVPWTAARCNRLLRTITSRLSILERVGKTDRRKLQTATPTKQCSEAWERNHSSLIDVYATSVGAATPCKDPEWVPQDRRDGAVATYGGKARLRNPTGAIEERGRTKSAVGMSFPTPFVRRILRVESTTLYDSETIVARTKTLRKSKQLPIQSSSSVEEAHRNLLSAFDSFLICTTDQQRVKRSSVSSLRSMALRRVPQCIELEDSQSESHECDVAFDLYEELEILGTRVQGGWEGLRQVVRAHGVRKLEVAVTKRLLPNHVIKALISICEHRSAVWEGKKLLQATALSARTVDSSEVIHMLLEFCPRNGCRNFLFRALARLLQERDSLFSVISKEQLLWTEFVTAILEPDSRSSATIFLETFVLRGEIVKASSDAKETSQISTTLMNVVALVTAMGMSTGEVDAVEQSIAGSLFCSAANTFFNAGHSCLGIPLLFSNLVLLATGLQPVTKMCALDISTLVSTVSQADQPSLGSSIMTPAEFACEVGRCLDCLSKGAGEEVLRAITRGFLKLAATAASQTAKVLQKLALDTAATYLARSGCKTSEEFLDEVEALVLYEAEANLSTPRQKIILPGVSYRWEAGIQEWIVQTPFAMRKTRFEVGIQATKKVSFWQPPKSTEAEGLTMSPTTDVLGMLTPVTHSEPHTDAISGGNTAGRGKVKSQHLPFRGPLKRSLSDGVAGAKQDFPYSKRVKVIARKSKESGNLDMTDDAPVAFTGHRTKKSHQQTQRSGARSSRPSICYLQKATQDGIRPRRIALRPIANESVHTLRETLQKHRAYSMKSIDADDDCDELAMDQGEVRTWPSISSQVKDGRKQDSRKTSLRVARDASMYDYDGSSEDELAM